MKNNRRRRHLRPRPTRSQVHHQIQHVISNMRLFQAEWILEVQQPQPNQFRLRFLHDAIVAMRDEIAALEEI
jgi:ubiquinone biosynthesis protein UbiJ